jgi:hypothetical protein
MKISIAPCAAVKRSLIVAALLANKTRKMLLPLRPFLAGTMRTWKTACHNLAWAEKSKRPVALLALIRQRAFLSLKLLAVRRLASMRPRMFLYLKLLAARLLALRFRETLSIPGSPLGSLLGYNLPLLLHTNLR